MKTKKMIIVEWYSDQKGVGNFKLFENLNEAEKYAFKEYESLKKEKLNLFNIGETEVYIDKENQLIEYEVEYNIITDLMKK